MGKPLRVLMVEDSEDDALLVLRELRAAGYDLTLERVDTAAALAAALDRHPWDLVIGDYSMPHFSGTAATGGAGYLQRPAIRQRRGDMEASRWPAAHRAAQRACRTQCGGTGRLLRDLCPGRDRPAPPAAAGVAVAKDGSRRAVGRRGRARLQQPAHRDHELLGPPAGRPGPG